MERHFIINPVAGQGKGLEFIPLIEKLFPKTTDEENIHITKGPGHATDLACEFSGPNKKIYGFGGDGTIHEIVNGIFNGTPLSIIPVGSGNDMIKSLSDITDPEKILLAEKENVIRGIESIKRIDKILVNNDFYCLNVASIGGIDAWVGAAAEMTKKIKIVPPNAIYAASVIPALLTFKAPHVRITINGRMVDHEAPWKINEQDITLFAACNGGFYGGKYNIAPHADLTDGLLDIYYVDKISKFKIYSLMSVLERGEHEEYTEFIHHFRTDDLTIESDTPLVGNFDGQVKKSKSWHIEDCHQELLISTPEFKVLRKAA